MTTRLLLDRPYVEGVTEPGCGLADRAQRDQDGIEGPLTGEESTKELDRAIEETEERKPENPAIAEEEVESNKGSPPLRETPVKAKESAQDVPKPTKGLSPSSKDSKADDAKPESVARSNSSCETLKRDGKRAQPRAEPTQPPERRSKDSKTGDAKRKSVKAWSSTSKTRAGVDDTAQAAAGPLNVDQRRSKDSNKGDAKIAGHVTRKGWVLPKRDTKAKIPRTDPAPSLASRFGFEKGKSNDPKQWTVKGSRREVDLWLH